MKLLLVVGFFAALLHAVHDDGFPGRQLSGKKGKAKKGGAKKGGAKKGGAKRGAKKGGQKAKKGGAAAAVAVGGKAAAGDACRDLSEEFLECAEGSSDLGGFGNVKGLCVPKRCGPKTDNAIYPSLEACEEACKAILEPETCNPADPTCCSSGLKPAVCEQSDCPIDQCVQASECALDLCNNCAVIFLNEKQSRIPGWACVKSDDLCPNGAVPLDCKTVFGIDDMSRICDPISCETPIGKCELDGCNNCELKITDAVGEVIPPAKCERAADEVCSTVTCPDMGEPDCRERPTSCDADFKLKCIVDKCACKWRWFSSDIRPVPPLCNKALYECFYPSECPVDYTCPSKDNLKALAAELESETQLEQLECEQEACTCRPQWTLPQYGIRKKCTDGDVDGGKCCPDGLYASPECPTKVAEYNCKKTTCDVEAANCWVDGCNHCGLIIVDIDEKPIDAKLCRIDLTTELNQLCKTVTCPAEAQNLDCPPRPSCFPDDWQLKCILHPCSCRPTWYNEDVRAVSKGCENTLRQPPIPIEDCPSEYTCEQPPANVLAELQSQPDVLASLICVQEPNTCRPVLVTPDILPPSYRLPCGTKHKRDCCADGTGPKVCPSKIAEGTCSLSVCNGVKPAYCTSDDCNGCDVQLHDAQGNVYPVGACVIPFDEGAACAGVTCPDEAVPDCPPRPDACPADWSIRCVRDPCSCSRKIWIDEDVRFTSAACSDAITPSCTLNCPKEFSCVGIKPGQKCIQEPCTCRPVVEKPPEQSLNDGLATLGIG